MANPKHRKSKCRQGTRRAHLALEKSTIVNCPNCGETMLLHRVCPNCGHYKGQEVVKMEEEES